MNQILFSVILSVTYDDNTYKDPCYVSFEAKTLFHKHTNKVLEDVKISDSFSFVSVNHKPALTYARYILAFKLWKRIVRGADQRRHINQLAIKRLEPPPSNLSEIIKTGILNGVLPNIPKSRKDITGFLIQAKFNAKEKSQELFKVTQNSSQFELLSDTDRLTFFSDDGTNADKNNVCVKGENSSHNDNPFELGVIKPVLNQPSNSLSLTSVVTLIDEIWLDIMKPPRTHRGRSKINSKSNIRNSEERRRQRFVENRRLNKARSLPRHHKHYNDNDTRKNTKYKSSFKEGGFRNKLTSQLQTVLSKLTPENDSDTDSDSVTNHEPDGINPTSKSSNEGNRKEGAVVDVDMPSDCSGKQSDAISISSISTNSVCGERVSVPLQLITTSTTPDNNSSITDAESETATSTAVVSNTICNPATTHVSGSNDSTEGPAINISERLDLSAANNIELVKVKSEPLDETQLDPVPSVSCADNLQVNERNFNTCPAVSTNNADKHNTVTPTGPSGITVKEEVGEPNENALPSLVFGPQSQIMQRRTPLFCGSNMRPVMPIRSPLLSPVSVNEEELTERMNSVLLIGENSTASSNVGAVNNNLSCFTRDRVLNCRAYRKSTISLPVTPSVPSTSRQSLQQFTASPAPSITLKSQSSLFKNTKNALALQNFCALSSSTPATATTEGRTNNALSRNNSFVIDKDAVSSLGSIFSSFSNLKCNTINSNKLFITLNSTSTAASSSSNSSNLRGITSNFLNHPIESRKHVSSTHTGFNVLNRPPVFDSRNSMTPSGSNTMLRKPSDLIHLKIADKNCMQESHISKGHMASNTLNKTNHLFVNDPIIAFKSHSALFGNTQCTSSGYGIDAPRHQLFNKNIANSCDLFPLAKSPVVTQSQFNLGVTSGFKSYVAQNSICNSSSFNFGGQKPSTSLEIPPHAVQESLINFFETSRRIISDNRLRDGKISSDIPIGHVQEPSSSLAVTDRNPSISPSIQERQANATAVENLNSVEHDGSHRTVGNIASYLCVCDDNHSPERSCTMTPVGNNCCSQQMESKTVENSDQNCIPAASLQPNEDYPKKCNSGKQSFARLKPYTLQMHKTHSVVSKNEESLVPNTLSLNEGSSHSLTDRISENEFQSKFTCSNAADDSTTDDNICNEHNLKGKSHNDKSFKTTKRKSCAINESTNNNIKRSKQSKGHEEDFNDSANESLSGHNTSDDKLVIDEEEEEEISGGKETSGDVPNVMMDISVAHEIEIASEPKDDSTTSGTSDYVISKTVSPENKSCRSYSDKESPTAKHHSQVSPPAESEKRVPSIKIKIIQNTVQRESSDSKEKNNCGSTDPLFICEGSKIKRVKNKRKHRDREHHSRHRTRTTSREDSEVDQEIALGTIPKSLVSFRMSSDECEPHQESIPSSLATTQSSETEQINRSTEILSRPLSRTADNESESEEKLSSSCSDLNKSRLSNASQDDSEHEQESTLISSNETCEMKSNNDRECLTDQKHSKSKSDDTFLQDENNSRGTDSKSNSAVFQNEVDDNNSCDDDSRSKSSEMVVIKQFQMTRAEADKLHAATCEMDRRLCMSQFKFRDYFSETYNVSPSVPVPYPAYIEDVETDSDKPPNRCPCMQCSENLCVLIANYKKLTQYRNTRLSNDVEFRKHQDDKLIRQIEKSLEPESEEYLKADASRWSANNTPEPDCSLPLKKRKTFTHIVADNSDSSNHQQEQDEVSVESNSLSDSHNTNISSELPEKSQEQTTEPLKSHDRYLRHYSSDKNRHCRRSCNEDLNFDAIEGNHSNSSTGSNSQDMYNDSCHEKILKQATDNCNDSLHQDDTQMNASSSIDRTTPNRHGSSAVNDTNMAVETLLNFAYNIKHQATEFKLNKKIVPSSLAIHHSQNVFYPEHNQMISSDRNDLTSSRHLAERDPRIRKRNRNRTLR